MHPGTVSRVRRRSSGNEAREFARSGYRDRIVEADHTLRGFAEDMTAPAGAVRNTAEIGEAEDTRGWVRNRRNGARSPAPSP